MFWVAAILLGTSPCQGSAPFDFETKAASLGQVVERLSAQTGAKIKASPKLAHEIVFVHAKGVRLEDLKAKLAETVAGVWTRDGDTEYLTRSAAQDKAIWTAHIALRRKLVDEALKDAKSVLEWPFDARTLAEGLVALPTEEEVGKDPTAARARSVRQRTLFARAPLARLLNRLVLACNPNDLAAVGPFERAVFSASPTRMQRVFDRKQAEAALAAFGKEQQAWIEEAAKVGFAQDPNGMIVSDPRGQVGTSPTQSAFTLEVRRGEMTALFNVNLLGDRGQWGRGVMSQSMFADPARKFLDAQMTPGPPIADDPVVELSEDSKEFSDRMREAFTGRTAVSMGVRMQELMLGVERNDPLSWVVSDALEAYAKAKGLNVIAAVPDSALSTAFFVSREQPLRVHGFMKSLLDSGAMQLAEAGGWAVLAPADRFEAALDFTPRSAVATLVKAVFAQGRLDVRDYARYALESKRLNRGGIGDWFLAMIDRSVLGASDRTDWNSLRLYGSFNAMQQRDLEAGARYPYGAMDLEQRKIVERIVYAGEILSEVQSGGGTTQWTSTAVEPTEAFAMGVPPDCTVTARGKSVPTLVAYGKGLDGRVRPLRGLGAYTVAEIEAEVLGDPQRMSSYGVAGLVGYAPGTNRLVLLRVEIAPKLWKETAITVSDFDPNATPVPWDKLPEPYPQQIAAAIEQVKARKANPPARRFPPPTRP